MGWQVEGTFVAIEEQVGQRRTTNESGGSSGATIAIVPLDEPEIATPTRGMGRTLPFFLALPAVTLTYWTIDILSPALPAIKKDLELSAAGAGLVFSLLFLGRLIGNFPAAILVDRIGAALTATIGGATLAVGSLAASFATSGTMLLPARVVQGIGIALLVTAALRSVLRARPGEGAAMTYFTFSATLGGVFGLQSGGILTESISWRAVFALCVVISATLTLTSFAARNRGVLVPGTTAKQASGIAEPPAVIATATATAYTGSILPSLVVNFLVFVNYSVWVALPLYAERRFDANAETNANLLLVITIMHLVVAFPAGRAIRKWGGRQIMLVGLMVSMVGTLLVLPAPGLGWMLGPLILYGAGMVAASNAGSDIVLQRAGLGSRAVGLVRLSSDLGLVLGPIIGGFLSDKYGYRAPFVALPIVTAIAVVVGYRDRAGK